MAGLGWAELIGRIVQERDSEGTVREWEGGRGGVVTCRRGIWMACVQRT